MEAIRNLLTLFIVFIMVGVVSVAVFITFDNLDDYSDKAGDDEATVNNIYDNIRQAVTIFLGLLIVGGLILLILGKRRRGGNQYCVGGECYEFNDNKYLR